MLDDDMEMGQESSTAVVLETSRQILTHCASCLDGKIS